MRTQAGPDRMSPAPPDKATDRLNGEYSGFQLFQLTIHE